MNADKGSNRLSQRGGTNRNRDFSIHQKKKPDIQEQELFWHRRLGGVLPILDLPIDHHRSPVQSFNRSNRVVPLDKNIHVSIRDFGSRTNIDLFISLLSAYLILLHRYTNQEDIVVGTFSLGDCGANGGMNRKPFVNPIALRSTVSGDSTVGEIIEDVSITVADALCNNDYPFSKIVDVIGPIEDFGRSPVFQTMLMCPGLPVCVLERPLTSDDIADAGEYIAGCDLVFYIFEAEDTLNIRCEYDAALFASAFIEGLLDKYRMLLKNIPEDPDHRISELPLLTDTERHRLLETWNATQSDYPKSKCVHQLFEDQAARTPDNVAVVFEEECLTYARLNERANQLAHHLRKLGIGPNVLVGICIKRSLEMVVGLLGILKAGGAYVPLDPSYPSDRLLFMLEDSRIKVLLTQEGIHERLPAYRGQVLIIDSSHHAMHFETTDSLENRVAFEDPAYVIYTSGSTGRPKGVMIPHRALANYMSWLVSAFSLAEEDRMVQTTPFSFDMSIWEFYLPLLNGAAVIIARPDGHRDSGYLCRLVISQRITHLQCVPAMLHMLLEQTEFRGCTTLRRVFCGGEELSVELQDRFFEVLDVELYNMYGPTEATIVSIYWHCIAGEGLRRVPIGRPIANTQAYILDGYLQPVPEGVTGMLYLGGDGLALGYLNRPDLTAEKFISNPFSTRANSRLYNTGDLARYRSDGIIEYLGRVDHQVKIRGFRIELGEIESTLKRHPTVQAAVVVARGETLDDKRLVAYVIPVRKLTAVEEDLRDFLKQSLPEYMVPSAFVMMDAFPLMPNGKINRKALPSPDLSYKNFGKRISPLQTRTERLVAEIWEQVLNLKSMGRDYSFFELGGHSLLATQVIARVREVFGIGVSLEDFFAKPTIAHLAGVIDTASFSGLEENNLFSKPVSRKEDLPLSFPQEQVIFISELAPDNTAYNFQMTIRLMGKLNYTELYRTFTEIIRRHDIFRTTFHIVDGQPIQRIHPSWVVDIPLVDIQATPAKQREDRCEELIRETLTGSFDIKQLPLIRWKLIRLGPEEHILIHIEHHLVHDGWSVAVFMKEFKAIYNAFSMGLPSPLEKEPAQFVDYAVWQRQRLQGNTLQALLAYWKEKLRGPLPELDLPTDRPRPAVQSFRGQEEAVHLPEDLSNRLRAFSRKESTTLFVSMLSAFYALLFRYSRQEDILLGTGIANRRFKETEGLIGMLVNTLVLRADLSNDPTFRELLHRVRKVTLEAHANQDLPFEKLVEALAPERDLSRNPLFQVLFSFHDAQVPPLVFTDLTGRIEYRHNGSAKFDLNIVTIPWVEQNAGLETRDVDACITMKWEYARDLFDSSTIQRMIRHYQDLLMDIIQHPEKRLSELNMSSEAERHQLFETLNNTETSYPRDKSVHQLFEEQAARTPNEVAIVFGEAQLTYAQLNIRANQLAHYLRAQGVGPETRVGICTERSLAMIVGLLGILKSGGAYVPLDPTYPLERLMFMIEDAQVEILLTQEKLRKQFPEFNGKVVLLDDSFKWFDQESSENLHHTVSGDQLAYVMYTSGTTGKPKGVAIVHRGIVRLVKETDYVDLSPDEVMLQFAPISFDAATFEIWGALLNGARLVVFPGQLPSLHELGDVLEQYGITTLWLTAGLFHQMVTYNLAGLKPVRQLLAGGDVLSVTHVKKALAELKGCRLINGYGPTENTTFTCCHVMTDPTQVGSSVPIGRPIANTRVYILDDHLAPVPMGVAGELYIGGDGLARGYLNRPELTREKFIPNPFSKAAASRLYKSGDLARYRSDGVIEFLGRKDTQVKIRGFRIELGEIEAVLASHPSVREAVAAVREEVPGDKRLVAYVVPASGKVLDGGVVRNFLKSTLPDYMLPATIVSLDRIPLTANGKVDRDALPVSEYGFEGLPRSIVSPKTPVEATVARIWAEVLGIDTICIEDNFFELGGHSLLATQVISKLRNRFQIDLPLRSIFMAPTVAGLASEIARRQLNRAGDAFSDIIDKLENISDEEAVHLLSKEAQNEHGQ